MSPPPNWANWLGMSPLSMIAWNCSPNASKMIGSSVPQPTRATDTIGEPPAMGAPEVAEQRRAHASGRPVGVLVELEEGLLEPGGLDGQVADVETREGRQERAHVALRAGR